MGHPIDRGRRGRRGTYYSAVRPGDSGAQIIRNVVREYAPDRNPKSWQPHQKGRGRSSVTESSGGGGGGGGLATLAYDQILDEAIALTKRKTLNVTGAAAQAIDDAGNDRTNLQFASLLNQLAALAVSNGDLFYINGSGVLTRLPIGSTGQSLQVASGLPSWATGGGGAPTTAPYLMLANDAGTSAERALALDGTLSAVDGGANGTYTMRSASALVVSSLPATGATDIIYHRTADDKLFIDMTGAGGWVPVLTGAGNNERIAVFDGAAGIKDSRGEITSTGIFHLKDGSGNDIIEINSNNGSMLAVVSASNILAHAAKVSGDTDYRMQLQGSGALSQGSGSAPADVVYERKAVDLAGMGTGDQFWSGDLLGFQENAAVAVPAFISAINGRGYMRGNADHQLEYTDGVAQPRDILGNVWNLGAVAPVVITNTAVQTQFGGGCVFAANELGVTNPGATIRVWAEGLILRAGGLPAITTLQWFITFTSVAGAVNVFATAAVPLVAAFAILPPNEVWVLDARMTLSGLGAGVPTLQCAGFQTWTDPNGLGGSIAPAWSPPYGQTLIGPFNIDTTLLQTVTIGVLWNAASPANIVSIRELHVDKS